MAYVYTHWCYILKPLQVLHIVLPKRGHASSGELSLLAIAFGNLQGLKAGSDGRESHLSQDKERASLLPLLSLLIPFCAKFRPPPPPPSPSPPPPPPPPPQNGHAISKPFFADLQCPSPAPLSEFSISVKSWLNPASSAKLSLVFHLFLPLNACNALFNS